MRQEGIQLAMCLDCENNGQALAWETASNINTIYGATQHRGTTTAKIPTTRSDFYDNMRNMVIKNQPLNK